MARHKSIERTPNGINIRIQFDGKEYDGAYTVDGPMVTVQSPTLGIRRAPVGDGRPEAVAKLVLAELAHESTTRRR
jgi:hypothetical protein